MTNEDFNKLNNYVSHINEIVPIFYGILKTMVGKQDEHAINIKIPEGKYTTLSELSSMNSKLDKTMKLFNVDSEFSFDGFDKGSDWIVLVQISAGTGGAYLTYNFFVGCLKITQEFFKIKAEYFKSKEAELNYRAALKKGDEFKQKESDAHQKRYMELLLEDKIKTLVDEVESTNGETKPSLTNKLVMATKSLIELIEDEVEFHLSLNPPSYAKEDNGVLTIDYSKMPKPEKKETPKIDTKKKPDESSNDQGQDKK